MKQNVNTPAFGKIDYHIHFEVPSKIAMFFERENIEDDLKHYIAKWVFNKSNINCFLAVQGMWCLVSLYMFSVVPNTILIFIKAYVAAEVERANFC